MSVFGVDYAWGRPGPAALKQAGAVFVARYLSHDTSGKNLTRAEADELSAAGIWIVVVWETTARRALDGAGAGQADARDAAAQAQACGMPPGRPIFFAVDFDATVAQQVAINQYLDGAASVLGRDRVGIYGGYGPVSRAFDDGKAAWGWQTYAWSAGRWDERAQLQQYLNGQRLAGVDVDHDRAMATDYGQWRVGETPMTYTAAAAIGVARGEIGYREIGTNDTKFNRWLGSIPGYPAGGYGYPWCASFLSWAAARAGGRPSVDYPKTASCLSAVGWFKSHDRWSSTPHVGDWVFYGPDGGTHVETVTAVTDSSITTVGGNTSGSLDGQYFNGDGVYAKTVSRASDRIYGYGRPIYQEENMPLSKDDLEAIRKVVWESDRAPAPGPGPANPANPTWAYVNVLRETYSSVQQVKAAVAALAAQSPDVDEAAIVQGVLAGLAPDQLADHIAAALAPDVARSVADEIRARLES